MQSLSYFVRVVLLASVMRVSVGQGCIRMFGRGYVNEEIKIGDKTDMDIAHIAVRAVCRGTCSQNYVIPDICPLEALSVEYSMADGYMFLPTFDMLITVLGKESQEYLLNVTFDYNVFTEDVFVAERSYVEIQPELEMEESFYIESEVDDLEDESAYNETEIYQSVQKSSTYDIDLFELEKDLNEPSEFEKYEEGGVVPMMEDSL
eukprot:TRINITY_DN266_c0_g2_i2.p1 TRINITY_DN266_c0_g2~~TRINITY_DN266_c0_g2_i2.p1  ORF type:complete len:205 (+),score=37.81 TRINITY_DN266_c0_g2_i2:163-777(+)